MTAPPLTDKQLDQIKDNLDTWPDEIASSDTDLLLADNLWHRTKLTEAQAENKIYKDRFSGIIKYWAKALKLETMETLLNGGSPGAERVAELVCAWDAEKTRADNLQVKIEKLQTILQEFVSHPDARRILEEYAKFPTCAHGDMDILGELLAEARAALLPEKEGSK
mgnify:CR=1 FL=1